MILVDSNVIMYAAGREHPRKRPSAALLEQVAVGKTEAAIDAEVLQEILHRYMAIDRWREGKAVYDLTRRIFPTVFPLTADIVDHARLLLDEYSHLMARDALHAAIAQFHSLEAICTFDRDFDCIKGLRRIEPR